MFSGKRKERGLPVSFGCFFSALPHLDPPLLFFFLFFLQKKKIITPSAGNDGLVPPRLQGRLCRREAAAEGPGPVRGMRGPEREGELSGERVPDEMKKMFFCFSF